MSAMKTANRAERRKHNTRERLKQAALEVLYERGYHALTVQAITDHADLGYGTFYLHFKDKDEIVWELLEDIGEQWMAKVNAHATQAPSPRREYLSWIDLFQFAAENRQGYVDLFGKKGSAYLNQRMMDYIAAIHLYNLDNRIYTSGLDLPPEVLAQFMTGAIWRLTMWWLETPNDYTPEQMADMVYEMVYRQPPPK
jgi:AcrR family transcriptional regulator